MNEIPLSDVSMSEVCARVSYALAVRRLCRLHASEEDERAILSALSRQLDRCGWKVLSFWVSAYAHAASEGERISFTRTGFIFRARMGFDFRGVAYPPYKRRRNSDPPVSNTGVTSPPTRKGGSAL